MEKRGKKKAQVNIIVVVILIVIALVAVIILWSIIGPLIESSTEKVTLGVLTVKLKIDKAKSVLDDTSVIVVERKAGEGDLDGVKIVFENKSGARYVYESKTNPPDELGTVIYTVDLEGKLSDVSYAELYPIIKTAGGEGIIGSLQDSIGEKEAGGAYEPGAECEGDSECDDGNECTTDSCSDGSCQHTPINPDTLQTCCEQSYVWAGNLGELNCCGDDALEASPYESTEVSCEDGNDNDCDGDIDSSDNDCGPVGIPISSCGEILTTNDATYFLTEDLNAISGDCIDIQASGITLDCGGWEISSGGYMGIKIYNDNNIIKNCKFPGISFGGVGIYIYQGMGNIIKNSSFVLPALGGSAINLTTGSSNNLIENNTFSLGGGSASAGYGVYIEEFSFINKIKNNNFSGIYYGVYDLGSSNTIQENVFSGLRTAVYLGGTLGGITLENNNITGSSYRGIDIRVGGHYFYDNIICGDNYDIYSYSTAYCGSTTHSNNLCATVYNCPDICTLPCP